jgi:hypothetical protein
MSAVEQIAGAWHADEELPANPFEALRVSFGMLLGEEDFRTLMGNPRGKQMLHSAWLHGAGVVWGYPIDRADDGQLRVGPGLAIDGIGRELALHAPKCIDVDRWVADQRRKGSSVDTDDPCADPPVSVACLVAYFDLCPTRPVPALADPCDLNRTSTEPSRLVEQVHLKLVPQECPSPDLPYHRVRVLLGLDEVGSPDTAGQEAAAELAEVLLEPPAKRAGALLAAFRQLLAKDVAELRPRNWADEQTFPVSEEYAGVPLARISLSRGSKDDHPTQIHWEADITVRRGLVATSTIQELTCGLAPGVLGGRAGQDAGGPRVVRDSVYWEDDGSTIVFNVTTPLMPGSLSRNPVTVSSLGSGGWDREDIDELSYDGDRMVRVRLYQPPSHQLVRLIVRGTGPTPITGTTGIPLAGLDDGEAGTKDDGHDAVLRIERRTS